MLPPTPRLERSAIDMKCPGCGNDNPGDARFCGGCGITLYSELDSTGIIGTYPTNPRPMPTMTLDDMVRVGRLSYHDPDYKQKLGI